MNDFNKTIKKRLRPVKITKSYYTILPNKFVKKNPLIIKLIYTGIYEVDEKGIISIILVPK